jgi:ATP-dependent DNA helicase PIF1
MTQTEALNILKTGANVFLTGQPGSGKTHTINQYVSYLRVRGVEPAITASTGIAATHIGGMTIHSWSGVGIKDQLSRHELADIAGKDYIRKRIKRAKVLIIDEISMLPPQLLSMVDAVCRKVKDSPQPFGGMQVILVGDFFQLPPIQRYNQYSNTQSTLLEEPLAIFSYDSPAWKFAEFKVCYLSEQHRQDDRDFLAVLSAIRRNQFNSDDLAVLLKRRIGSEEAPENVTKLFSHNSDVDQINYERLSRLAGPEKSFIMTDHGSKKLTDSLKKSCLSPELLRLKVGAEVMFTKNNPQENFCNGTLGKVKSFSKSTGQPIIKLKDGREIEVAPMEWVIEEYGEVRALVRQIPLRLAWAITVHKSQGMSLDAAVMDLSRVFEFGQGYVALSRIRRLSGLYLLGHNEQAFFVHPEVLKRDQLFVDESKRWQQEYGKISPAELKLTHDYFINDCGGCANAVTGDYETPSVRPKIKKAKKGTHQETVGLWLGGWTLDKIAKKRELTVGTILTHLEKAKAEGLVKPEAVKEMLEKPLLQSLPEIAAAFRKLDTEKLSPVFEFFGGEYSYYELRLARLALEK